MQIRKCQISVVTPKRPHTRPSPPSPRNREGKIQKRTIEEAIKEKVRQWIGLVTSTIRKGIGYR
jgi:hypothetical protein